MAECGNSRWACKFLSLAAVALPLLLQETRAVMPQVNYLGTVLSVDEGAGTITVHAERFAWTGEEPRWEICSFDLDARAPLEEALHSIRPGDYLEVSAFGTPGDCGDTWVVVAKLSSNWSAGFVSAFGDVGYLFSPLKGGFKLSYTSLPDCSQCSMCPEGVPYTCAAKAVELMVTRGGETVATETVEPGETWRAVLGDNLLVLKFLKGKAFAFPHCTRRSECVGPQLVCNFSLRVTGGGGEFIRGDANADGRLNVADAVCILGFLFGAPEDPCASLVAACRDAADTNDDGKLDIADPVAVLGFLFGGSGALPPPSGACGVDGTEDPLDCKAFEPCLQRERPERRKKGEAH